MTSRHAPGQVWHFSCDSVPDCDDYYLLLRDVGAMLPGIWEVLDLVKGEITYVLPEGAGEWRLMSPRARVGGRKR